MSEDEQAEGHHDRAEDGHRSWADAVEQIAAVPGIGPSLAARIKVTLEA